MTWDLAAISLVVALVTGSLGSGCSLAIPKPIPEGRGQLLALFVWVRASSDDLVTGMPVARHSNSAGLGEDISFEQSVGYAPTQMQRAA